MTIANRIRIKERIGELRAFSQSSVSYIYTEDGHAIHDLKNKIHELEGILKDAIELLIWSLEK